MDLLQAPPAEAAARWHQQVVQSLGAGVEVREAPGKGKGIFATQAFAPGDVIFRERALVSQQEPDSCQQLLACAQCHRFVGSIELQTSRLLSYVANKGARIRARQQQHASTSAPGGASAAAGQCQEANGASSSATAGASSATAAGGASSSDAAGGGSSSSNHAGMQPADGMDERSSEGSQGEEDEEEWLHRLQLFEAFAGEAQLSALAAGRITLPLSDRIQLPAPVYCAFGCGACYCSSACRDASWQHSHCLLCSGSHSSGDAFRSQTPVPQHQHQHQSSAPRDAHQQAHLNSDTAASSSAVGSSSAASSSSAAPPPLPAATAIAHPASGADTSQLAPVSPPASLSQAPSHQLPPTEVYGMAVRRDLLPAFYEHAASTNAIFGLAARLLAGVAVQACRTLAQEQAGALAEQLGQSLQLPASSSGSSSSGHPQKDLQQPQQEHQQVQPQPPPQQLQQPPSAEEALQAAWLPYAVGWKRLWWECVAVPPDVEEEVEFRSQLRELACDSLSLLRAALPGVCAAWPALLQPDTWGGVIGMFELNNLGLAVPSPVEEYFLMVDELPEVEKEAAQQQGAQQWLDALDKWYDTPVEGTGFYALQSCANHSCAPNAATEGEADGRVAVYALAAVAPGQEVTLSYLDQPADQPWSYKQRQAALQDYGFQCACSRCEEDRARQQKKKQSRPRGVKLGRR